MTSVRTEGTGANGGAAARPKSKLRPVGFWSYSRQDDKLSAGKLSRLRSMLMAEIQQQYGRDRVTIFQDASTIPHGAQWEQEISKALNASAFLIPIVTPNFIQSEWCCREVAIFLEREKQLIATYPQLGPRSRIFPIHLIDVADVDPHDPDAIGALEARQWFDFRGYRFKNFDDESVQRALSDFASSIRMLLHLKVEEPLASEPRAAAADSPRSARGADLPRRRPEARAADAHPKEDAVEGAAEHGGWEEAMRAERLRLEAEWRADAERRIIAEAARKADRVQTPKPRPPIAGLLFDARGLAVLVALVAIVAAVVLYRPETSSQTPESVATSPTMAKQAPSLSRGAAAMQDALAAVPAKDWMTLRDESLWDIERRVQNLGTLADMRALAESGNPRAQYLYARSLKFGQFGAAINIAEANEYYRRAAAGGDPRAQVNMGLAHEEGAGVPRNDAEAARYYAAAAAQGYGHAQHNLAILYTDGRGVARDYARAMLLAKQAADQGHAGAYSQIAYLHAAGLGVPQDYPLAVGWARSGANMGDADAQYRLGLYLYEGRQGVPQDRTEGLKWLRRAAGAAYKPAQSYLKAHALALQ